MALSVRRCIEDKRGNQRIRIEMPVGIALCLSRFGISPRHPQFAGSVLNASMVGMEIRTAKAIPPGTRVKLWVDLLLESETLILLGDVVWRRDGQDGNGCLVGIQLCNRPKKQAAYWADLVVAHIRRREA